MALSPSHRFGQIIGDVLELALTPRLDAFAKKHELFLDHKGLRRPCRGKKITWEDNLGNVHDLDFVLERGGTLLSKGTPAAFIETAWRRYTKHSRNKAQEMQSAIQPLAEKYKTYAPFIGAVLAGVFTEGAITQLESQGFAVLYIKYEIVIEAFSAVGIDARFDEDTADNIFQANVDRWQSLPGAEKDLAGSKLMVLAKDDLERFITKLTVSVVRKLKSVRISSLYGNSNEFESVERAIDFISNHDRSPQTVPFVKFELTVEFTNGDHVSGIFTGNEAALKFLKTFLEF